MGVAAGHPARHHRAVTDRVGKVEVALGRGAGTAGKGFLLVLRGTGADHHVLAEDAIKAAITDIRTKQDTAAE